MKVARMGEAKLTTEQRKLVESVWEQAAARATSFAKRIRMQADDMLGAAHAGLMEAARRYDPAKGDFRTYAMRCVDGGMLDEVARQRKVSSLYAAANIVRREALGGFANSSDELDVTTSLAAARSLASERVRARVAGLVCGLILERTSGGGEDELHASMRHEKRKQSLVDAQARMSAQERRMYRILHVEGRTHAEAATELGTSTKSIQRLNQRVLARLASSLRSAGLELS